MKKFFKLLIITFLFIGFLPIRISTVQAKDIKAVDTSNKLTNLGADNQLEKLTAPVMNEQQPSIQAVSDEEGFSDEKSAEVLDGNARLTLKVTKTGSSLSTSVGDDIHVEVTLEKITDASELFGHENSSLIVPYPKEENGMSVTNNDGFQYTGATGNNKLYPMDSSALSIIMPAYDLYHGYPVGLSTGTATQVPGLGGTKGQSIFDNLIMKGDKIHLSYDSELNSNAVGKDTFTLASGFYDSEGAGDFTDELKIQLPGNKITDWELQLDDSERDVTVDPKDVGSYVQSATGNWKNYSGENSNTMEYQVDDGVRQIISSSDLDQTNKTFITDFDLSKSNQEIESDGDHTVTFYATIDGIEQSASLLIHVSIKKNTVPTIQLDKDTVSLEKSSSGEYSFHVTGVWNDADSDKVSINGEYPDSSEINLTGNSFENEDKGADTTFDLAITTETNKLKLGINVLKFIAQDSEGAISRSVEFTVIISEEPANEAPTLKLASDTVSLDETSSSKYTFHVKGTWNDADSNKVTIHGEYSDGTSIRLTDNSFENGDKGTDTAFDLAITTESNVLKVGTNILKFTVKDSDNMSSIAVNFTVEISAVSVNSAPHIKMSTPNQVTLDEATSGIYTINVKGTFNDVDSDKVTIKGSYPDNSGISLTGNSYTNDRKGEDIPYDLTITTVADKLNIGTNELQFIAKDSDGAESGYVVFTVIITAQPHQNERPHIKMGTPNQVTLDEATSGIYTINVKGTFNDVDSDKVTIKGSYPDNSGISITGNSYTNDHKGEDTSYDLTITTAADKLNVGTNELQFIAKDSDGAESGYVVFTVDIIKTAPTLKLIPKSVTLSESESGIYSFHVKGTWNDRNSDKVTIIGQYPDNTGIELTNDTFMNDHPGTDVPFDLYLTSTADKLKLGNNILKFAVKNSEGVSSSKVSFTVEITPKTSDSPILSLNPDHISIEYKDSGSYSFSVSGKWMDRDSSNVQIIGTYEDGSPCFESRDYPNSTPGEDTTLSLNVSAPVKKLLLGTNKLLLTAVDSDGSKSQVAILVIKVKKGSVSFETVSANSSFQFSELSSGLISEHKDDWQVSISDTTEPEDGNPSWKLEATQERPFEDKATNRTLSSEIEYKDSSGEVTALSVGTPVVIDMKQSESDKTKYNLGWSNDNGFQLPVKDSEYAGSYESSVKWTIVDAP